MKITEQVEAFAKPIVEEKGCTLWDVEYVREGSERFLRVYIDKEGGVCIDDCEAVARAMDPILDERTPSRKAITSRSAPPGWNGPCGGPKTLNSSWALP